MVTTLTDHSGFKVHKNSSRDMLSSSSLTEKCVEGIISSADGLVTGHLTVWLNAMFQAVKLPAGIPNLDTSLSNVDGDAFTLWEGGGSQLDVHLFLLDQSKGTQIEKLHTWEQCQLLLAFGPNSL